jgi:CubicO group peptidase (beta-lactamase class C family)
MIRYFHILYFFVITASASAQGFSADTEQKLDDVLTSFQSNSQNPVVGGISAAIVVDGVASWKGASGYAARNIDAQNNLLPGGTAFTLATPSQVYSVTKTFTAALVLELAREGAIHLSDPITQHMPLLPQVNPALNVGVTIRQLLAHESGYSDYTSEINLQIAVAFNPARIWTPYEMVSFVHQIAAPGTERRYSSTNYILLGAIIEAATGKTIAHHFRTRFFTPFNLASMYFSIQEQRGNRPEVAAPHDNISAFNPIFALTGQPTYPAGYTNISRFSLNGILSLAFTSGGVVSDSEDLARWGNALFGGRATSSETLETMLKSISPTADEDGDKLGYGIFENEKISTTDRFIGHDGNAPGYRSVMFYQPDRKMTLVVLTNYHGLDIYAVARKLYEALPGFLCGNENRKEDKIQICFKGKPMCIARQAAWQFISKGAVLGNCASHVTQAIRLDATTAFDNNKPSLPTAMTIFPNPSRGNVNIRYTPAFSGPALVQLYDSRGALVSTIFSGNMVAGEVRNWRLNATNLRAGIYLARIQTSTEILERKLVVH